MKGNKFGMQRNVYVAVLDGMFGNTWNEIDLVLMFFLFFGFFFFFCLFAFSGPAPSAYGSSQDKGPIRAVAAGLPQSHCNTGSELHLRPTPQLMTYTRLTMPDP